MSKDCRPRGFISPPPEVVGTSSCMYTKMIEVEVFYSLAQQIKVPSTRVRRPAAALQPVGLTFLRLTSAHRLVVTQHSTEVVEGGTRIFLATNIGVAERAKPKANTTDVWSTYRDTVGALAAHNFSGRSR